jgi:hypothetical protein
MAQEKEKTIFPGDFATPKDLLRLAEEYKKAASLLMEMGKSGKPLSRAPYRLVAIHAIELYLNTFLLKSGYDAAGIRSLKHDLGKRAQIALENKLILKKKTFEHIKSLSQNREYLVTRYEPEMPSMSQVNRLEATLKELAEKVAEEKK